MLVRFIITCLCGKHRCAVTRRPRTVVSCPSLYPSLPSLLLFLTVANVSGTRVFRATGLSLILLWYLFVFCTTSLQPQTSPSPPTPCSSSFFFFFFFYGICPCHVLYTSFSRRLALSTCPGLRASFSFSRNCSNFDPRDTAKPVGMWTLHVCALQCFSHETVTKSTKSVNNGSYRCIDHIFFIHWLFKKRIIFIINHSQERMFLTI